MAFIFNTLKPGQNRQHLADDIFKYILLDENYDILIKFYLDFFLISVW